MGRNHLPFSIRLRNLDVVIQDEEDVFVTGSSGKMQGLRATLSLMHRRSLFEVTGRIL
jgi:hypothetical protein